MFSKKWFKVLFMLCLCVVVAAGCRTKSKKTVGGEEDLTVNPPGNGTTEVLPERTTDAGTPVAEKFETVLFAYDSFQVADAEAAKIVKVGEFMKSNADVKLTTDGHCDERGSAEYNMSLGEHRALAVRAYLVGLGIDAARIQTKSFGRETPVDARHCEEAWRQNRRVEFSLSR